MRQFIKSQPSALFVTQLTEKIKMVREEMRPHVIDMSEDEKGGRSMAEGREGVVRKISEVALAHNESLGKRDNAQELKDKLNYDSLLEQMRQSSLTLMEAIAETQLANSIDCMTLSDRYLNSLQGDRNNNSSLDLALREIDDWNKRFGARPNTEKETTPPEGTPPPPAQTA